MYATARPPTLAPAALAYAGTCVLVLALLPVLEAPLETFGAAHPGRVLLGTDPTQGVLWGLGLGLSLAAAGQVATRTTDWGRRFTRLLERFVGGLHPADALLLAALSGAAEELFFRGILLPYTGLVASSALFGLAHLVPRKGLWPWAAWATAAGVGLGWLAVATSGLLAPIVAHAVINAVGLLLLRRPVPE